MKRLICLALLLFAASFRPALAVTPERVITPGGFEAWLIQDHANPIMSLEVAWRDSGSAHDPAAKLGLGRLMAGLLDEGAGPYDSQAFQRRLEDLSIKLSFSSGADMVQGHLTTLSRNREQAFEMLRLALSQPHFEPEAVLRVKGQIEAGLAQSSEEPASIASKALFAASLPDHAYGRENEGTPETVRAITESDLRAALGRLGRDNLIIGVVGDITPQELSRLLDSTFAPLPARSNTKPLPQADVGTPQPGIKPLVIKRPIPQSVVQFAFQGIKRDDPDWFAAYVMNYILGGGGFSSRLTVEVREKRGLAYSVYSYFYPFDHGGLWLGGVATENAKVAQSLSLIRRELARMQGKGVSAKELADAKTFLTGSFPLRFDSSPNIAGLLVAVQSDRLGLDYLEKRNALVEQVTLGDVRRVAKRLMAPEKLIVIVVGQPKGL
ncbi:MAG: insulinase family protein [Alphaproteobacteria bacterium]|nr:insulinase family protein [Alphaproteobacteria bacterium]